MGMCVVVAYDVVDNKRRNRVMKLLKGHGAHVQKSVFECHLDTAKIRRLAAKLADLIDEKEDTVRMYILPRRALRQVVALGVGQVTPEKKVVVV